jgi:hypothetical protein
VMLASGSGVAYAATCPGMDGSGPHGTTTTTGTTTTGTGTTTTTTGTTTTSATETTNARRHSKRHAPRHRAAG